MWSLLRLGSIVVFHFFWLGATLVHAGDARPNILWITAEDIGPHLGCYGDSYATTPHIDEFAKKAVRYTHCWSNAPVCAPARTTIISGRYASSLGAEHMRSLVHIPNSMKLYPEYLRQAGYYCSNNNKTDYNIVAPPKLWNDTTKNAHWKNRKPDQPFFAIFNSTQTHESQIRTRPHKWVHDPAQARIPAYHPDTLEVRQDWAQYYDNITLFDEYFHQHMQELEAAGLTEDTIVFVYGDHGSGMPRNKRSPCNSGYQVPMLVCIPEKFKHLMPEDYKTGGTSDRLVSFVDLAPTLLKLLNLPIPETMQGHPFLGHQAKMLGQGKLPESQYLFGFRGRMDERYDISRSVRDQRYCYVRNYNPQLDYGNFNAYMFETPTTRIWKEMFDAGKLNGAQSIFWQPKASEELYDLQQDPDEVHNLAADPAYKEILTRLANAHADHVKQIRDIGFLPEEEFHRRCAELHITPYELGHDAKLFDLDAVFQMAQIATIKQPTPENLQLLTEGLNSNDSGVRYWAVLGIQLLGQAQVKLHHDKLVALMEDPIPCVAMVAEHTIALYSPMQTEVLIAINKLVQVVHHPESSAYEIVRALNYLDRLDEHAVLVGKLLQQNPIQSKDQMPRSPNYMDRMYDKIFKDAGLDKTP